MATVFTQNPAQKSKDDCAVGLKGFRKMLAADHQWVAIGKVSKSMAPRYERGDEETSCPEADALNA